MPYSKYMDEAFFLRFPEVEVLAVCRRSTSRRNDDEIYVTEYQYDYGMANLDTASRACYSNGIATDFCTSTFQ